MIDISDPPVKIKDISRFIDRDKKLVLFLDYDGTLVDIYDHPHQAKPSKRLLGILGSLNEIREIDVYIISGRGMEDILSFFGKKSLENISWVASHGAELKIKKNRKKTLDKAKRSMKIISLVRKELELTLADSPCYFIEDKSVSFSIHYRNCSEKELEMLDEIKAMIKEYENIYDIDSMEMKKVIEVKSKGINKGLAVRSILEKYGDTPVLPIAIGDDVTDEYTFKANKKGINIKVSDDKDIDTKASYCVEGPKKVLDILDKIIKIYI